MDSDSSAMMTPSEASTDRISDLPDNVIDHIMTVLPIPDAARMSIMSKNLRNYWLSISGLEFDLDFAETVADDNKWYDAISNVLEHHEGPLTGFGVTIPSERAELCPDIRPWIQTISRKGVKHLAILSHDRCCLITVPSHLFSCAGLESFYVSCVTMCPVPAGFMGFRSLTILDLDEVVFLAGTFKIFMACCPVLKKLQLLSCKIDEPVIIDRPNLTDLTIEGAYECLRLKNTSNLVSLSLTLDNKEMLEITDEWPLELIKFVSSCKLENLVLSHHSCEVVAKSGISRILPTTFVHMKSLSLHIREEYQDGFFCGVDILQSCPNIESLKITLSSDLRIADDEEPNAVRHDGGEKTYTVFNNLKEVIIDQVGLVEIELQLVAVLLAASPSLDKLTYTCKYNMTRSARSKVRRRICKFQTTSTKLRIVYRSVPEIKTLAHRW